jgi:murein DD-endopeptidase MepM/ murein hydrolase activator NlpD
VRWSLAITAVLLVITGVLLAGAGVPLDDPIWWYTNESAPEVVVDGPRGTTRGQVEATITLMPRRAQIVSLTIDGRPQPVAGGRLEVDSARLPDGRHDVQIVARDTSRRRNQAVAEWSFTSDNSAPRLEVRLDPAERLVEGRTILIRIRADEPTPSLQAAIDERILRLERDGTDLHWKVEGVSPGATFEARLLQVRATDAVGNETTWEKRLELQHTAFPEENLDLDPEQIGSEARTAENARLQVVYDTPNGPKRWDGQFRVPVEGPVTTEFGTRRSYEYHPGTDFGAPLDAPVVATARGVVVVATAVPARGNVIVLDHGAGVYSTYGHLQAFEVEPGAEVTRGQVIGRVGSTGFSTGPHLHWELWVDGANVDPMEWTRRAFP